MSESQTTQLRRHLDTIHDHFDGLYGIEPYAIEIEFKITSEDRLAIKQARPWVFGDDAGDVANADQPPPSTDRSPTPTPPPAPTSPSSGGGGGGFGPAPVAPSFTDGFRTRRGVAENARNGRHRRRSGAGQRILTNWAITYSLSGADAASFTVDEPDGADPCERGRGACR